MKYFVFMVLLFFVNKVSYSNSFSFDFRGYIEQEKMLLGKKGELINFKSKGTWSDSLGNYGRGRCRGSGLLENKIITDIHHKDNIDFMKNIIGSGSIK